MANLSSRRNSEGQTQLIIPPESVLSETRLTDSITGERAVGPSALDDWALRNVSFTVRTVPRSSTGRHRITIPYPHSPEMQVTLSDPFQLISAASIAGRSGTKNSESGTSWTFFPVFSEHVADLQLKLQSSDIPESGRQQSQISCIAEISPSELRLTTTYVVTPADRQSTQVRVAASPRYRIIDVKSPEGNSLPWTNEADAIVIQVAPNPQDEQHFVVRQAAALPLALRHRVHLDKLRNVNGRRADSTQLSVTTGERFVVDRVTLERPESAAQENSQPSVTETEFQVPDSVSTVRIQLTKREVNREAYLHQTAVVQEEQIAWSCRCRLDISGQPVYRQHLLIPNSVVISNAAVTSNGVSRLQSWTRGDGLVVVALREATRGLIELELEGNIARADNADTTLPEISLPNAQILESSIEISAAPDVDAFIRNLGSTVPGVAIDVDREMIPVTPLRLSVQDESKPIVVRAKPRHRLTADVAVLIYEIGDQPLLAQLIALSTPDATFDVRFRLLNDGYPAVNPEATRNDETLNIAIETEEYRIPRASREDRAQKTILIIPHLIPPDGQRVLPVSLPDFDAEFEVSSHSLFDLRSSQMNASAEQLPEWLSKAGIRFDIAEGTRGIRSSGYQFDETNRRFRINPIQTSTAAPASPKRVVAAVGTHTLNAGDQTTIVGYSSLLAFCSEINTDISLSLPPNITTTEVKLNGQPQTIDTESRTLQIPAQDRVSHISVNWLVQDVPSGGDVTMTVPGIEGITTDHSVIAIPPDSKHLLWSVDGETLTKTAFTQQNAASLRRAIRLINPGFRSAEDSTATFESSGLDPSFREQLATQSAAAAASFEDAVRSSQSLAARSTTLVVPDGNRVRIRSSEIPSPLQGLALLTGTIMVLLSTRRRSLRHPPPAMEADTEISASLSDHNSS